MNHTGSTPPRTSQFRSGPNFISGILFNEVSNFVNQTLYKIFKTDKIRLNVSAGLYNRNLFNQSSSGTNVTTTQGGNINVNLPVSFFKGG